MDNLSESKKDVIRPCVCVCVSVATTSSKNSIIIKLMFKISNCTVSGET